MASNETRNAKGNEMSESQKQILEIAAAEISYILNSTTGDSEDPHVIGTTEDGRRIIQRVEGWEPCGGDGNTVECETDEDGNWIES